MRCLSRKFTLPRLINIPCICVNDDALCVIFGHWIVSLVHLVVVAKTHLSFPSHNWLFVKHCLSPPAIVRFDLLSSILSIDLSSTHISPLLNVRCSFTIHTTQNNTQCDLLPHFYSNRLLIIVIGYKLYIISLYIYNNILNLIMRILSIQYNVNKP